MLSQNQYRQKNAGLVALLDLSWSSQSQKPYSLNINREVGVFYYILQQDRLIMEYTKLKLKPLMGSC